MQEADAVQISTGLTSAWRLLQRSQRLWRAAAPVWAGQGLLAGALFFGIALFFPPPGIPFLLAGLLLLSWLAPGLLRTAQRQLRGERIEVSEFFSGGALFPSMLPLLLLASLPLWIALIGSAVIGGLSGLAFASISGACVMLDAGETVTVLPGNPQSDFTQVRRQGSDKLWWIARQRLK